MKVDIERNQYGHIKEVISLTIGDMNPRKVYTLDSPYRLVVDIPKINLSKNFALPKNYKGSLMARARGSAFDRKTTRLVFDLKEQVRIVGQSAKGNRLKIAIMSEAAASGKKRAKAPAKKAELKKKAYVPLIVIDPGHGGKDPGAVGKKGTKEKHIVFAMAKLLEQQLHATGRYRVQLTRRTDKYIRLSKRIKMARKAKADVFLSLHADSAPQDVRGMSFYTLSENASDKLAAALAKRENKSDIIAGLDLGKEDKDVADILISLAQRETNNRSSTLADFLVNAVDDYVPVVNNTHRFAGFAVLKAPDVPSVLVELGFLSHPKEEKLLRTKSHRNKIAKGIIKGLDRFFKHERKYAQLSEE